MKDFLSKHWSLLAALVLLVLVVNQCTANLNRSEILRITQVANDYKQERDDLEEQNKLVKTELNGKDIAIETASKTIADITARMKEHEQTILDLQTELSITRFSIRDIDGTAAQVQLIKETYPDMASARGVGITEFYDEEYEVYIDYLVVPLRFAQTFIIEHEELQTAWEQIAEYEASTELCKDRDKYRQQVTQLERDKFDLMQQLKEQYRIGYEAGYDRFDDLQDRYVKQLEKPRIDFGGWIPWIGGALAGGAACGYLSTF